MSYTPEEKDLLRAARLIRDNCSNYIGDCEGCLFDTEDGCVLYKQPDDWEILSEEEEGY